MGFGLAIFFGAFLLFQVQPLMGKCILPWFGGGPAVWTACMLFFQVLLLVGYAYAHLLRSWLKPRTQVIVHLFVMAVAAAFLPIAPSAAWKPESPEHPTWRILALLTANVGLPYFLLATTSPLLQAWFSATRPGESPYRLYAVSNAGSLLALVSYPFVVEPSLTLRTQILVWSLGFGLFAIVCGCCAARMWSPTHDDQSPENGGGPTAPRPAAGARILWIALPACGSLLLLAITNQICFDVATVPFLWVLPLTLYLLSYVLCFQSRSWYVRPVFLPLLIVMVQVMVMILWKGEYAPIAIQIAGFSLGLFACCMVCHGELARLKPCPRYLTAFYFCCALGGALGGLFVAVIAPLLFDWYLELHLGIWFCCLLAVVAFWYQRRPRPNWRKLWPTRIANLALLALLLLLGHALRGDVTRRLRGALHATRNFYGVLRVVVYGAGDAQAQYGLVHGRIVQGRQFVSKARRREPTAYFGEESGIGRALLNYPRRSGLRVGIIGLGTGTIAAYGRPGDRYTFYEINPAVARLARTWFTFLDDSQAQCDVVLGDARLSLERQEPQKFDVLALDAFNSDAIPVHLLTREAFDLYLNRHLKPDGVLAAHISNNALHLEPVVRALAEHFEYEVAVIKSRRRWLRRTDTCTWALVTRNRQLLDLEAIREATRPEEAPRRRVLWTDDYSSLLQVLK